MSQENVQLIAECFRAWDRADLDAVVANYAADVEVDASRVMEGVYQGRDAVREYYRSIFDSLSFVNEDLKLIAAENQVVAVTRLRGVGSTSQAEVETPFAYIFTIEDGNVQRVCFYADPAEAVEAVGLSE